MKWGAGDGQFTEGRGRTARTFNDRELRVMAGNAAYLTPPSRLILSHEITPAPPR